MPIRFDAELFEEKRDAAKVGVARRFEQPFALAPWAVDPVDMMTVEQFMGHLIALYGPEYLEPVPYVRTLEGRLVPGVFVL